MLHLNMLWMTKESRSSRNGVTIFRFMVIIFNLFLFLGKTFYPKIVVSYSMTNFSSTTCSWNDIIDEAKLIRSKDEFMTHLIDIFILEHSNFSNAIVFLLAHSFAGQVPEEKWLDLFKNVHKTTEQYNDEIKESLESIALLDLSVIKKRDPASDGFVNPFLNFKGYKALQAHRIAHVLWNSDRKDTARAIQARCSELFAVDIHPAAKIGFGLFIDHGTGIVIGETAVVGNNCSFLHGVTLGSTGKDKGENNKNKFHKTEKKTE
jgi:serine O-acetyltransferase